MGHLVLFVFLILINPLCYHVTNTYNNFWSKICEIPNIISSCILCLRFPFLYPRNRFTGKHHTIWWFENNLNLLRSIETNYVNVVYVKESDFNNDSKMAHYFTKNGRSFNISYNWMYRDDPFFFIGFGIKPIFEFKNGKILKRGKINKVGYFDNAIHIVCTDDFELSENAPRFTIRMNENRIITVYIRFIKFLYWICSIPFAIPTYTELDSMPNGWRKAFGIKMCKEIRKELIKSHSLFSYRIMQIKEKYGTLRWYDAYSPTKKILDIINKYENLSYHTCITCGKKAEYISTGWISPYCKKHIGNKECKRIDENNLYI